MTDRELMEQALEALEFEAEGWECVPPITREAIAALRERLAQPTCNCNMRTRLVGDGCEVCNPERARELAQPEQEPVAWVDERAISWLAGRRNKATAHITTGLSAVKRIECFERPIPLYTAPPQRKPLTDEVIGLLTTDPRFSHIETPALAAFARVIERAHGIGEKK